MDKLIKVQNVTSCVGGDCSAGAANASGLTDKQNQMGDVYTA